MKLYWSNEDFIGEDGFLKVDHASEEQIDEMIYGLKIEGSFTKEMGTPAKWFKDLLFRKMNVSNFQLLEGWWGRGGPGTGCVK
ncbi:MAG: hypothetical protein HRT74_12145 [Flavobacteriales bacterium]|nr:hypothetical protein [Flavobacteriales bacterium]